jgi:hypothetical protein
MIRNPTAPRTHLVFDVMAWSSGLAMSVVLYRWRLRDTVGDRGLVAIAGHRLHGSLMAGTFACDAVSRRV